MKKLLVGLLIVLCLSHVSHAQLTVGANIGFNMPTSGIAVPRFVEIDQDGTATVLIATLGAGLNYNAQLGYQFNENVAGNLDLGYFSSFKGAFHQWSDQDGNQTLETRFDNEFKARFIHLTPNVVIQANPKEGKWRPYGRFGLIVGWARVTSTTTSPSIPGEYELVYSGGTSIGFLGGFGFNKAISEKMTLFAELSIKTVTAYPKRLENPKHFTGVPQEATIKFVDTIKPNSPDTDELTFPLPFSSFGLTVGVTYKL